ncbi:hypothetical protein R69927_07023 [Paraburkholderia domus]|uniref:Uncharacterized protein n=1 Tax=Paraburkholderia domus TaxID=2793075 RepID=A0A9N8N7Z2_9BURK|nr:hypothetical protein R75483_07205 [Paraburkholderia domus]CAE6854633.1 hypothetical protein R70006_07749 [Paraburkholderia domus]CAE6884504.1 hypothetical protein R69749_07238 [Paraburkholderia domus]CAE6928936.1 hypothetical protein R69927_07023 [Paraburkholderia domus]CAE6963325.1 hypothetical protein R70211_07130 [Paraburkholderia domus]
MPDPLDIPVPQRFSRFLARQRVRMLRVAQLPLQHGRLCVVRTERRMPLSAGPLIASAERKHALPLGCVPFQRGGLCCHRSGRAPLTPARVGQRAEPAAHPQTTHPREQPPKIHLLRRAAHHTGGSPAHKPCKSARVSAHELHRSYGWHRKR